MRDAATAFRERLAAEPGCTRLPTPAVKHCGSGLQWDNLLLRADRFRRTHVEFFAAPGRVCVLHVCGFPHLDDPSPIFGFDMVAGPARVTGIFLDLSPVGAWPTHPCLGDIVDAAARRRFAMPRALPPWGDIFSNHMLAVRPTGPDDVASAIGLATRALEAWLASAAPRQGCMAEIAAGQARYVAAQRRNDHTLRMLSGFIGPEPARRFIDDVLFPAVLLPAAA